MVRRRSTRERRRRAASRRSPDSYRPLGNHDEATGHVGDRVIGESGNLVSGSRAGSGNPSPSKTTIPRSSAKPTSLVSGGAGLGSHQPRQTSSGPRFIETVSGTRFDKGF